MIQEFTVTIPLDKCDDSIPLQGLFDLLPHSIVTEELFLQHIDYDTLFFRFSKVNKHFRTVVNDWTFINKIMKHNNIFDIVLLDEFKSKLNTPESKYHIIIKPCLTVKRSFEQLHLQNIVFSEDVMDIKQCGSESNASHYDEQQIVVYKPDIKQLLTAIKTVHSTLKKQYPIFLQQLGYLCSYIGSQTPDFQNIIAPYGVNIRRLRYKKYLERNFMFPFTSFDWAGHGEGGESDGTVTLTNEPTEYGKLRVIHSELFTHEKDYVYEKIDDPHTDDEQAASRAEYTEERAAWRMEWIRVQEEYFQRSPSCSAVTFLKRVMKILTEKGLEGPDLYAQQAYSD